jgi:PLP dependent protein
MIMREGGLVEMKNVRVIGLMGMASFTTDMDKVRSEFRHLKSTFDQQTPFTIDHLPAGQAGSLFTTLSSGMSSDYKIALEEGSTMVRIGSLLFGERAK